MVDAETSLAVTLPPWAAVDEIPARSATASNASVASAVESAMAGARVSLAFSLLIANQGRCNCTSWMLPASTSQVGLEGA